MKFKIFNEFINSKGGNMQRLISMILAIAVTMAIITGCTSKPLKSLKRGPNIAITEVILQDNIQNQEICKDGIFEYEFKGPSNGFCRIKPRPDKSGIGVTLYFDRATLEILNYFNACSEWAGCNVRATIQKNNLILFRVKP